MRKIEVVKDAEQQGRYRLRIWISADNYGCVMFDSAAEFTRTEADFRAVSISSQIGLDRDYLTVHPHIDVPPDHRKTEIP